MRCPLDNFTSSKLCGRMQPDDPGQEINCLVLPLQLGHDYSLWAFEEKLKAWRGIEQRRKKPGLALLDRGTSGTLATCL